MIGRRGFMAVSLALAGAGATALAQDRATAPFGDDAFARALDAIEAENGGKLGIAVLDTATGRRFARRGDERFPLASTFKVLLAGAILARVDAGGDRLDRTIAVAASDIVAFSPVVQRNVGRTMTVGALCEATVTRSDNAAANLLLHAVEGPAGLTRFVRTLGDGVTRIDRTEPAMNEALPGDPRDTTTPSAMVGNLAALLVGATLAPASRARLTAWMVGSRTGDDRLRAGLPRGWRVGDKTGLSRRGDTNDVAIAWPPSRPPLLIAAYLRETAAPRARNAAALAAAARAIAAALHA